jgi:hypothetical protein
MDDPRQGRSERAAERRSWPVRRYRLGAEPGDDFRGVTSAQERLAMMWELAIQSWRLGGRELPEYTREQTPGRVVRPSR